MAEQLSAAGVPAFLADIKGDLSGVGAAGTTPSGSGSGRARRRPRGRPAGSPVELYALGGIGTGVPVRATITSFGPVLLSKVLDLNPTQESSLGLVFHFADQAGLPLLDLKDLRAVITHLTSDEGKAELKAWAGCRRRPPASSCVPSSRSRTTAATCSSASPSSTPPTCSG
jgi:DNA helicase HerA-like ATPase